MQFFPFYKNKHNSFVDCATKIFVNFDAVAILAILPLNVGVSLISGFVARIYLVTGAHLIISNIRQTTYKLQIAKIFGVKTTKDSQKNHENPMREP